MKEQNRILHHDIIFVLALLAFAGLCVSRFFDHALLFHRAPMALMYGYRWNEVVTAIYYLGCFFVFCQTIRSAGQTQKKNAYYLIVFSSVFLFPMFLSVDYFGSMDVYAWVITFGALLLLLWERLEWLLPLICFAAACICPMAVLSSQMLLYVLLLYLWKKKEKKFYAVLCACSVAAGITGVVVTMALGTFSADFQHPLSLKKFVVMLVLLSPYAAVAVHFLKGLMSRAGNAIKKVYGVIALAGVIAPAVMAAGQDYARAVFYGFTYYSFLVLFTTVKSDEEVSAQLEDSKQWVTERVPVPAVFILYAFLFMTFWISGPLELIQETLLGS